MARSSGLPEGGFSLPGMRIGLVAVAVVVLATAAVTRFPLPRD
ncbi:MULTISPECIES: hypothetical protein [unclassified Streptomyces]|nr:MULTISPECIES: hypothetical protein [unclassified Streptomyces]